MSKVVKGPESSKRSKLVLVFLFILILAPSLSAQFGFSSGYVIEKSGDTLRGMIKRGRLQKMSENCFFRKDKNATTQEFDPNEIQGFKFDEGKFFLSKSIVLNGKEKRIFLEFLVNGEVDLFIYRNGRKRNYYVEDKKGKIYPLLNTEVIVQYEGGSRLEDQEEFKTVLNNVFNDAPELSEKLEDTDLRLKILMDITEEYHNIVCDEYNCINYRAEVPTNHYVGIITGVGYSELKTQNNPYFGYFDARNQDRNPIIAVGVLYSKVNTFGFIEGLNFNAQVDYQKARYSSRVLALDVNSLSIPLYFTYNISNGPLKPTIGFGVRNNFFIKNEASIIGGNFSSDVSRLEAGLNNVFRRSFYQVGLLTGGLEYELRSNIFILNCGFEFGGNINRTGVVRTTSIASTRSYGVNVGFKRLLKNN